MFNLGSGQKLACIFVRWTMCRTVYGQALNLHVPLQLRSLCYCIINPGICSEAERGTNSNFRPASAHVKWIQPTSSWLGCVILCSADADCPHHMLPHRSLPQPCFAPRTKSGPQPFLWCLCRSPDGFSTVDSFSVSGALSNDHLQCKRPWLSCEHGH
jgi:hypothetical protein